MFSLVMSSKLPFWPAATTPTVTGEAPPPPLGHALLNRALAKELVATLHMTKRATRGTPLKFEHLFPHAEADPLSQPPQLILAGSLVVQAALSECWKPSDVDLFCTCRRRPRSARASCE